MISAIKGQVSWTSSYSKLIRTQKKKVKMNIKQVKINTNKLFIFRLIMIWWTKITTLTIIHFILPISSRLQHHRLKFSHHLRRITSTSASASACWISWILASFSRTRFTTLRFSFITVRPRSPRLLMMRTKIRWNCFLCCLPDRFLRKVEICCLSAMPGFSFVYSRVVEGQSG